MGLKLRKTANFLLAFLLTAVCFLLLLFPLPASAGAEEERYLCEWEDGTSSTEGYASAFACLTGIGDDGWIELKRGTHVGRIRPSFAAMRVADVFRAGELAELIALDLSGLSRIERAALFCEYGDCVWYAGDAFRYTGRSVSPSEKMGAKRVSLLMGELPEGFLKLYAAASLHLGPDAEFRAADLIGSRVCTVTAAQPYRAEGGQIFLDTPGGRRLVAALPDSEELVLFESDFADMGALSACEGLRSLTIPYAGNMRDPLGGEYRGEVAWLFIREGAYCVPATLEHVKVTGGKLGAYAFYACPNVVSIDACGLAAEDVSAQAFLGADGLRLLHTPRADVVLNGEFSSRTAPCGCTVYERITEEEE